MVRIQKKWQLKHGLIGVLLVISIFLTSVSVNAAERKRLKILFLGNSITLSEPGAAPGWNNHFGMAATSIKKDFVHLITEKFARKDSARPAIKAINIAQSFEIEYVKDNFDIHQVLSDALAFKADLVVVELGANIRSPLATKADKELLAKRFFQLLSTLKENGYPEIFVTGPVIGDALQTKEKIMRDVATSIGCTFVSMEGFAANPANLASSQGVYANPGVGTHPSDTGMKWIADRLFKVMSKRRLTVGCYYFPAWTNPKKWYEVKEYGKVEPLIGYYKCDDPRVFDVQIRQALANGIDFFSFCWYYDHMLGSTMDMTGLDDGFLKSTCGPLMRFSIFWCNEMADAQKITHEQMLGIAKVWKERYFCKPNYMRINGKPVVNVSKPTFQLMAMGKEGTAAAFREMAKVAGEPNGIFFIASEGGAESWCPELNPAILKEAGFSAVSAYAYSTEGLHSDDYAKMINTYERIWRKLSAQKDLPYFPPVTPGYDSTSVKEIRGLYHNRKGSTPQRFREMCKRVLPYIDKKYNIVMIEAWNEYYEGTHLEPTKQDNFAYLNTARDVFRPELGITKNYLPTQKEAKEYTFDYIPSKNEAPANDGNLIVNPGFEKQFGWITYTGHMVKPDTSDFHSGKSCLLLTKSNVGVKPNYLIAIEKGKQYKVTVWTKGQVRISSAFFDAKKVWLNDYVRLGQSKGSKDWEKFEATFKVDRPDVAFCDIEFDLQNLDGQVFIDDVEVRLIK